MEYKVTCNMTKKKAINMIIKNSMDYQINYNVCVDIFQANSLDEAISMGESASWELPDFENEAKEIYQRLQKEKQRLSKLPYHEILEIGEELGLWQQTEKQKRLI